MTTSAGINANGGHLFRKRQEQLSAVSYQLSVIRQARRTAYRRSLLVFSCEASESSSFKCWLMSRLNSCTHFSQIGQHPLSKDTVGPCLISLASLLQPSNDIRIQAERNGLFHGTIEAAAYRVFPCTGREFRCIRSVNLVIRQSGEGRQFAIVFGSEGLIECMLRASSISLLAHRYSVPAVSPYALR